MKKKGIMVVLALVLVLVMVIGLAGPVSAAKPQASVNINIIKYGDGVLTNGLIDYTISWDGVWVHYYSVKILKVGVTEPMYEGEILPVFEPPRDRNDTRTWIWRDGSSAVKFEDGADYTVEVQLYAKNQRVMKRWNFTDTDTCTTPIE